MAMPWKAVGRIGGLIAALGALVALILNIRTCVREPTPLLAATGGCLPYVAQPPGPSFVCVILLANNGSGAALDLGVIVPAWATKLWAHGSSGKQQWVDLPSNASRLVVVDPQLLPGGSATLYAWGSGPLTAKGGFQIATRNSSPKSIDLDTPIVETATVSRPILSVAELGGGVASPSPPSPPPTPQGGKGSSSPPPPSAEPRSSTVQVQITATEPTTMCIDPHSPGKHCYSLPSESGWLQLSTGAQYSLELTRQDGSRETRNQILLVVCCKNRVKVHYDWASGRFTES